MAEQILYQTVQDAFVARLATDELINFSTQEKITERAAKVWAAREKVTDEAVFVPVPVCGYFPDDKDMWAVRERELVESKFPYVFASAVDNMVVVTAAVGRGMDLQEQGGRPVLVTNFPMEQRSEREVVDNEGRLHGIAGVEMPLLRPVLAFLQRGFPRGIIHTDGHGLGLEKWAGELGLPVFTMTSLPMLFNKAIEHNLIKRARSVAVSGDVGGVMLMNMVKELAVGYGLEVETVYGEKRSDEVFSSWGQRAIRGAQVLFGDDIISSGKTLFKKVLTKAFDYGAKNAVVFIPHADLVAHTIQNLNSCSLPVTLVIGDTFPVRPEVAEAVAANRRLLRVPVFEHVMMAAKMDAKNLLTNVFTNENTQAELLRQTGMGIFPPYVERFRTTEGMIQ